MTITMRMIADIVAGHFGVDTDRMFARDRSREPKTARHVAFWLCARHTAHGHAAIGRTLGGFWGSSVIDAVAQVDERLKTDRPFADMVGALSETVEATAAGLARHGIRLKPDPDPLAIARRVLSSHYNEVLISSAEARVLATAVLVTFDPQKGHDNEQHD